MTRKPHHQKDSDNGDRRLREAAEIAWRVLNPFHIFTPMQMKPLKWIDMSSGSVNTICTAYDYPAELLKTDDEYVITITPPYNPYDNYPFEIKDGETYVFGVRCTEIDGYFWPIKDLPFDNLGI